MHRSYHDITSRITEPPKWYDEHAVPRYDEFHPRELGVYIIFAILGEIACQSCRRRMKVGIGLDAHSITMHTVDGEPCVTVDKNSLEDLVGDNFAWGDPPSHGGCVGETMGSVETAILEVWHKVDFEWQRVPEHEGPIELPDWFR